MKMEYKELLLNEEIDDEDHKIIDITSSKSILKDQEYFIKLFDFEQPFLNNLLKESNGYKELESLMNSDFEKGLDDEKLTTFVVEYGRNTLPKLPSRSLLSFFIESFQDHTLILLSIAAIASLLIGILWRREEGGWIESISIVMAVVIVVTVTSLNNYSKERQFQKLNASSKPTDVKCIRNGHQCLVSVHDLCIGDVVIVEAGMIIPADCVLIQGYNISCEESTVTGESSAVNKSTSLPDSVRMLSGSKVLEGYGRMVVLCIGENSINGKIMMSLRTPNEPTPLEEKLDELADVIGKIGMAVAIATFVVLVVKAIVLARAKGWNTAIFFDNVVEYMITAITIVVVVVPEGLPLAVTIALAYSMMKMLKENNLVRKLEACETMGNATVICSDKTGTLTENRMTVTTGWIAGVKILEDINGIDFHKHFSQDFNQSSIQLIIDSIIINSTSIEKDQEFIGNQTECSLLSFSKSLYLESTINQPWSLELLKSTFNVIEIIPFSSSSKYMATIIKLNDDKYRYYIKGASEMILDKCATSIGSQGIINQMSIEKKDKLSNRIKNWSNDMLRSIAVAYVDLDHQPSNWNQIIGQGGFTLIGLFGIRDPIRKGVEESVAIAKRAGMSVRMLTGDNIDTAKNIARKIGILSPNGLCMSGSQFRTLTSEQLDVLLPHIQVIARSTPLDKQLFIQHLKQRKEIVAVTGDGTNDAPALKLADVGFAMGISGTEIAKQSSDIIIMDDNFSSIVNSIKWGRNVMESIQKFLQFQLTTNIVACIVSFIGAVSNSNGESPLSAVQLLWINLIMDTLASLALATEEPSNDILLKKSLGKKKRMITFTMWYNIIGQAMFQLSALMVILFVGHHIFKIESFGKIHFTILFNLFVFMQLFNEFNCRRIHTRDRNIFNGIIKNWQFTLIVFSCSIIQVILIQFGGDFIQTTPLDAFQWTVCIVVASFGIPLGFIIKTMRLIYLQHKKNGGVKNNVEGRTQTVANRNWKKLFRKTTTQLKVIKMMKSSYKPLDQGIEMDHINNNNEFDQLIHG